MFDKTTCPKCGGTGKILGAGFMKIECPACKGSGKIEPLTTDNVKQTAPEAVVMPYDSPLPAKVRRGRPKGAKNTKGM